MNFGNFRLKRTLAADSAADLNDVIKTKRTLNRLGHLKAPAYGLTEFPDQPLFAGIRGFQRAHKLKADGVIKPGGETERTMDRSFRSFTAAGVDPSERPEIPKLPTSGIPKSPAPESCGAIRAQIINNQRSLEDFRDQLSGKHEQLALAKQALEHAERELAEIKAEAPISFSGDALATATGGIPGAILGGVSSGLTLHKLKLAETQRAEAENLVVALESQIEFIDRGIAEIEARLDALDQRLEECSGKGRPAVTGQGNDPA